MRGSRHIGGLLAGWARTVATKAFRRNSYRRGFCLGPTPAGRRKEWSETGPFVVQVATPVAVPRVWSTPSSAVPSSCRHGRPFDAGATDAELPRTVCATQPCLSAPARRVRLHPTGLMRRAVQACAGIETYGRFGTGAAADPRAWTTSRSSVLLPKNALFGSRPRIAAGEQDREEDRHAAGHKAI
jgi:hypothetical protein